MSSPRRICLDCRTALHDRPTCPGGARHRVVDLAHDGGRKQLVGEVWGPESWRRQKRRIARAGKTGAAAGGIGDLLNGCSACDGCGGADLSFAEGLGELVVALVVILAVALVFVAAAWAIGKLVAWIREHRNRPRPHGALAAPAPLARRRRVRGTIVSGRAEPTPLGNEAVGWALELACKRFVGSDVMLRDGATSGFDVELEGGGRVRVPPGALRLARGGAARDVPVAAVREHLRALDPRFAEHDTEPAIPFDRATAVELREGDRVAIDAPLESVPDADAASAYRGGQLVLAAVDVPAIRRL